MIEWPLIFKSHLQLFDQLRLMTPSPPGATFILDPTLQMKGRIVFPVDNTGHSLYMASLSYYLGMVCRLPHLTFFVSWMSCLTLISYYRRGALFHNKDSRNGSRKFFHFLGSDFHQHRSPSIPLARHSHFTPGMSIHSTVTALPLCRIIAYRIYACHSIPVMDRSA